MNWGYPPEVRRAVLDMLKAGRAVRELESELGVTEQTIYIWQTEDELVAARQRLRDLEVELAAARRATELLREVVRPKVCFEAIRVMEAEGRPVRVCARVVGVSESGYYAWRRRPPAARSIRHERLTEAINEVHQGSRATFGVRRVHAALRHGQGLTVARSTVELLMSRAGLQGEAGNPNWRTG